MLAYIIDEETARAGLERKGKGIAKSDSPDCPVLTGGRSRDSRKVGWIVARNGPVRVDAQHLAEPVRQRLRIQWVIILADGNVEVAVRSKVDRAAVMNGGATQIIQVNNNHFTPCFRDVGVGDARGKTADAIMGRRQLLRGS